MVCGFTIYDDHPRHHQLLIVFVLISALACDRRHNTPSSHAPAARALSETAARELATQRLEVDALGHGCMPFRELGLLAHEAHCLHLSGSQYAKRPDLEAARAFYALALAYWRYLDNHHEITVLALDLADIERQLGRSERAQRLLLEAAEIAEKQGNTLSQASALTALGSLHHYLGETTRALAELRLALRLLERHPRRHDPATRKQKAKTSSQLAVVLPFQYDARPEHYHEALLLLDQALALRRALGEKRGEAVTLNNRGLVYERMKRFEVALDSYQQALDCLPRSKHAAERAVMSANRCRVIDRLGPPEIAHECYATALAEVQKARYRNAEAQLLYGLADNERRRGQLDAARHTIDAGIEVVEQMRDTLARSDLRSSFLAKKYDVYDLAIEVALDQHTAEPGAKHAEAAFLYTESAAARSFLDNLSSHNREAPKILSTQAVQQLLDSETIFIAYHLGNTRAVAWVISRSEIAFHPLGDPQALEKAAHDFHRALSAGSHKIRTRRADRLGRALSHLVLAPIAAHLDRHRLVVVATGALAYVPFGALPHPATLGAETPEPLLLTHEIVAAPSASVVAAIRHRLRDRPPAKKLLAIVAAPTPDRDGKPRLSGLPSRPLPFAAEEGWTIFQIANATSTLALGSAANRGFVFDPDLRNYQILHFATHGLLDNRDGERSALALAAVDARGEPVDGWLRAFEISRLDLPAELVVLSACETALGEEIRGEGMVGLPRAFLEAGARQVLVSLWPVDDEATARLMTAFYRAHLYEGLPPNEALRTAQLRLRQEGWTAPYHWAPFILYGDWLKPPRQPHRH